MSRHAHPDRSAGDLLASGDHLMLGIDRTTGSAGDLYYDSTEVAPAVRRAAPLR